MADTVQNQRQNQEQRRVAASDASQGQRGEVPDTANTYERAKPDQESVGGQMTANHFTPDADSDDNVDQAVTNQKESRELTADDAIDQRDTPDLSQPAAEGGGAPRGTAASAPPSKGTANTDAAHQQQPRGALHQQGRQQNMAQRPETADQTIADPADAPPSVVQQPPVAVAPEDIAEKNRRQRQSTRDQTDGGPSNQQQSQQQQARQGRDARPAGADAVVPPSGRDPSKPISPQPDHSMNDEEPLGWDQTPKDSADLPAGNTRHPRQGGKGGTPDVGEANREG